MGFLTRLSLFGYGFRPFFLGAACSALVLVPWWAANFSLGVSVATDWPPNGCVCWPVWCAPRCVTAKIVECDPLHDRDGKTAALARRLTRCLFQGDLE